MGLYQVINPYLDRPQEQTVGTYINVSYEAVIPPDLVVTATVELVEVEGQKFIFAVEGHDGVDLISRWCHERFIINKKGLIQNLVQKRVTYNHRLSRCASLRRLNRNVPQASVLAYVLKSV